MAGAGDPLDDSELELEFEGRVRVFGLTADLDRLLLGSSSPNELANGEWGALGVGRMAPVPNKLGLRNLRIFEGK